MADESPGPTEAEACYRVDRHAAGGPRARAYRAVEVSEGGESARPRRADNDDSSAY